LSAPFHDWFRPMPPRLDRETKTQTAQAAMNERTMADVAAKSESVIFNNATTNSSGPMSSMAISTINGHMGSNDIKSTLECPL